MIFHYLCHYLNEQGYEAYIWPYSKVFYRKNLRKQLSGLRKSILRKVRGKHLVSKDLNTPLAHHSMIKDSIVVYPGKVSGNPLQAKNVVRYLLHKPGFHTNQVSYGKNELYFYYREKFLDPTLKLSPAHLFYFPVVLSKLFTQTNFGERSGTCFILRKGKNRQIVHDLSSGVVIDDLPMEKIAEVFNNSEYCISYDLDTFFTHYASLCGCKTIVVPEPGLSKEEWCPDIGLRYGIAYGENDLEWAHKTKQLLTEYLQEKLENTEKSIESFVEICFSRLM